MLVAAFAFAVTISGCAGKTPQVTSINPEGAAVDVDWNARYHYADLEKQLKSLNEVYPQYSELESIGKSYEDRDLWCMTITDESVQDKTKDEVAVFGNIHGDEGESASCAMYSAWYLLENAESSQVSNLLKKHVIYVIPVINPDGYEQSFIYMTRENLDADSAPDRDGDGIKFNDSYEDINGDGMVGTIYSLDMEKNQTTGTFGKESKDGNHNGRLADDPRNSGVDLNRNYDFMWGEDGVMDTEGPGPASESETAAVQNFITKHSDMKALVTMHAGAQSTVYPWGYRPADETNDKEWAESQQMKENAIAMSKAMSQASKRNYYAKQAYYDWQTYSELADYAYGKYGIQAYTVEVYRGGSFNSGVLSSVYDENFNTFDEVDSNLIGVNYVWDICSWNDKLPKTKKVDYTHEEAVELFEAAGIDYTKLISRQKSGAGANETVTEKPWGEDEGIRITYNSEQQMCGKAPEGQDEMVNGVMEGIITMINLDKFN
ncbi:MAG: M14 family zinc carboxypeptidase [Bacillota bacterium]